MKKLITYFIGLFFIISACCCAKTESQEFPTVQVVIFQQTLLRDAVAYLQETSGYQIRLAGEVEEIPDLWIDYRGDGKKLNKILDEVLLFIKQKHGIELKLELVGKKELLIEKR